MSDGDVALALIRHVRQTATCTVCKLPFRSPYLLPACLHTFCYQCIEPLYTECDEGSAEGGQSKVLCPQCSEESLVSLTDGEEKAVKDYFANKLLECTGHLLSLNKYGGNYSRVREFVKKLHDACECPVCQELCCQPRMLPCSHTFCESCIKRSSTNSTTGRHFPHVSKCPLCRQPYSHLAEGFSALPTNRLLSRILDKLSEPEVQQLVLRLVDPDSGGCEHREVIGIAELNGHLYVLQNKSRSIHVSLSNKPYSMLGDVALDGVIEPTDLAASLVDSCVYVTDIGENGCVWRVEVQERVAESCLDHVEFKFDRNTSGFEPAGAAAESAQGSSEDCERDAKQQNSSDTSTACAAAAAEASTESGSAADVGDSVFKTQDEASQPFSKGSEAGVDLQKFLEMITGRQVSALNVSQVAPHESRSSAAAGAERLKDSDAGEMIRGLLERTGVMKKISERGNAGPCVFEITRHYAVTRWVEGVRANEVSVGSEGQVLMVTDTGHLVIYGVDGQLIVDHSLPDDVQKPRHAVFSSVSGTFIVSHSSVNGLMHRVCELIMDPVTSCLYVARSYGSTAGSRQQHLHWPRHVTVDERGWMFVADCGNDRVLLLDEKLQLRRVMLAECDGITQPWRLCFIPETGILAVGSVTGSVGLFLVGGETKRKK